MTKKILSADFRKIMLEKGKPIPESERRKVTKADLQALKDAGIENPLWDDEPEDLLEK